MGCPMNPKKFLGLFEYEGECDITYHNVCADSTSHDYRYTEYCSLCKSNEWVYSTKQKMVRLGIIDVDGNEIKKE